MLDKQILDAAISSRAAWERIRPHIKANELTPTVAFWWKHVSDFYDRDSQANSADISVLRAIGGAGITNPKHTETIMGVLSDVSRDVSSPNIIRAVLCLKRNNAAAEFASLALSGEADKAKAKLALVNELWEKDGLGNDEWIAPTPLDQLFDQMGSENRIKLLPDALNMRIGGGARKGDHILIFGQTEMGKSLFAINMAVGLIRGGRRVLYVGNEDSADATYNRFIWRLTKTTPDEARANKEQTKKRFRDLGGEKLLTLRHTGESSTMYALRKHVEELRPDVVFIDQIRGFDGDEDTMTRKLEHNAIVFRTLIAKHSILGVSITQARNANQGHGGDSPIWLGAGDVDSSRVGLPGTVDLQLGIGGSGDMIMRGQRSVSICKNKLWSGPNSREGFIINMDTVRGIVS